MFYTFRQNNSGGFFVMDNDLTVVVIIEACCADSANRKLESLGGYFGGVRNGKDCPCCGDRWSEFSDSYDTATVSPEIYGQSPEKYIAEKNHNFLWADPGKEIVVYYLDGTVKWY